MMNGNAYDMPSLHGLLLSIIGTAVSLTFIDVTFIKAKSRVILTGKNTANGINFLNCICEAVEDSKVGFELLNISLLHAINIFRNRTRASTNILDLRINSETNLPPQAMNCNLIAIM